MNRSLQVTLIVALPGRTITLSVISIGSGLGLLFAFTYPMFQGTPSAKDSLRIRPLVLFVAILLFAFNTSTVNASFWRGCKDTLAHFVIGRSAPLQEGRVAVMFFPLHVELVVDGVIYRTHGRYQPRKLALNDVMSKENIEPFFFINFRATEAEIANLKEFLNSTGKHGRTCIGGTCQAINQNLGFTIPPLIRWQPEWTLAYLTAARGLRLDHGRISRVEFIGRDRTEAIRQHLAASAYIGAGIFVLPVIWRILELVF